MLVYILAFFIGILMMFGFFKGLEFVSKYKTSYKKKKNKEIIL